MENGAVAWTSAFATVFPAPITSYVDDKAPKEGNGMNQILIKNNAATIAQTISQSVERERNREGSPQSNSARCTMTLMKMQKIAALVHVPVKPSRHTWIC
jgi:hypothetical protein